MDEIIAAYLEADHRGEAPDPAELLARYPDLADDLRSFFANRDRFWQLVQPLAPPALAEASLGAPPAAASGVAPASGTGCSQPPLTHLRPVAQSASCKHVVRHPLFVVSHTYG